MSGDIGQPVYIRRDGAHIVFGPPNATGRAEAKVVKPAPTNPGSNLDLFFGDKG